MTPAEEIEKMWEDYEKKYPYLADHYRPPTIYVRGKSLDDKIEITHLPDKEDEKRKWIEYNEATYIPQLSPDYWNNRLPDFATFCKAFQRKK